MAYFRVVMHGGDICIRHDSKTDSVLGFVEATTQDDAPIIGFYTTRYVRGKNGDAAIIAAKSLLTREWSTPPLRDINSGAVPQLTVDSEKIGLIEYMIATAGKGFTFYSVED
jgi:hypothetical protein